MVYGLSCLAAFLLSSSKVLFSFFYFLGLMICVGIICFSLYVGNGKRLAFAPEVRFCLVIARRVSIAKLVWILAALAAFIILYPSVLGAVTRAKVERLGRATEDIALCVGGYLRKNGAVPESLEELDLPRELKVDPFTDPERLLTWYPCRSYIIIRSVGPDRIEEGTVSAAICDLEVRADRWTWLAAQGIRVYDPSNGTRSGGDIFLTGSY